MAPERAQWQCLRIPLLLMLYCSLGSLVACQSSSVVVDYDTQTDFSSLSNYHLLAKPADEKTDALNAERIHQALQEQLPALGLKLSSNPERADALICYKVSTETLTEEPNSGASIGFGSSGRNSGIGISMSFPLGEEQVVQETQIIIEVVGLQEELLWQGSRKLRMHPSSADKNSAAVKAAVREILSFYPLGPAPK